jgi:hypothetical protein
MSCMRRSGFLIVEVSSLLSDTQHLVNTPLDEGLARRKVLYLATNNTHKRQTSVLPAGFKPTIPASEQPQTQAF